MLLADPACRLLTWSPGGIGKTRLAIEAARLASLAQGPACALAPLSSVERCFGHS